MFLVLTFGPRLLAQDGSDKEVTNVDKLYIDFTQRELTAFTMLDIDEDEIVRPGSLRELAVQVGNFGFNTGQIAPFAIEVNPYKLFAKETKELPEPKCTVHNYSDWPKGFTIGLASVLGDADARVAGSLNYLIKEEYNPMKDDEIRSGLLLSLKGMESVLTAIKNQFIVEIKAWKGLYIKKLEDSSVDSEISEFVDEIEIDSPLDIDTLTAKFNKILGDSESKGDFLKGLEPLYVLHLKYNQLYTKVKKDKNEGLASYINNLLAKIRDQQWNAGSLLVSTGMLWYSPSATWGGLKTNSFQIIASGALPTIHGHCANHKLRGQLIAQVKYSQFADSSKFSLAARHLYGTHANRFALEAQYKWADLADAPFNIFRFTAGLELKITDNTWFEMAYGANHTEATGWSAIGQGTFKFGIGDKPIYSSEND